MKNLLLFTSILFAQILCAQAFPGVAYDKVVMYAYEGGKGGDMSIVDANGRLATTRSMEAVLAAKAVDKLNTRLADKKSYGQGEAACYNPRLGFVYYEKEKVVAKVDVCLECNRLYAEPAIPAQAQGAYTAGGETVYLGRGMSVRFRKFISGLLEEYGFKPGP